MKKLFAAALVVAASFAFAVPAGAEHNAVLPCNIPVPDNATVVSPGEHDCIVQYERLEDAAAVVHAAMLDGRFVYSNGDETGFISEQGGEYVVRVADVSPVLPLEVVFSEAS